jgi:hypothetical protein
MKAKWIFPTAAFAAIGLLSGAGYVLIRPVMVYGCQAIFCDVTAD